MKDRPIEKRGGQQPAPNARPPRSQDLPPPPPPDRPLSIYLGAVENMTIKPLMDPEDLQVLRDALAWMEKAVNLKLFRAVAEGSSALPKEPSELVAFRELMERLG